MNLNRLEPMLYHKAKIDLMMRRKPRVLLIPLVVLRKSFKIFFKDLGRYLQSVWFPSRREQTVVH